MVLRARYRWVVVHWDRDVDAWVRIDAPMGIYDASRWRTFLALVEPQDQFRVVRVLCFR